MADAAWGSVELLLHCEGANNSTTIVNEKSGAVMAYGAAKISTAKSKFGSSSLSFGGSGDRVEAALSSNQLFAQPFCLEAQVDTTLGAYRTLFSAKTDLGTPLLWVGINPAGVAFAYISTGTGGWSHGGEGTLAVQTTGFTPVAIDSNGTDMMLFVNGALSATFPLPAGATSSGTLIIGDYINVGQYSFVGNADEIRFTKASRYRAAYTPQVEAFSNTAGGYSPANGAALNFGGVGTSAYTAPLGGAVNFPIADSGVVENPIQYGVASGKISIGGSATGTHTSPKAARFASATGKVALHGSAALAAGVTGIASGVLRPRPQMNNVKMVPAISISGEVVMKYTMPNCVHPS